MAMQRWTNGCDWSRQTKQRLQSDEMSRQLRQRAMYCGTHEVGGDSCQLTLRPAHDDGQVKKICTNLPGASW